MNAKDIQKAVQVFLFEKSHPYQALNFGRCGYEEADVLAVTKAGLVTEVEVKVSISDFRADFKKKFKHYRLTNPNTDQFCKSPNRFYYACPEGLISVEKIPDYAGLIYVGKNEVNVIKKAPLIHKEKAADILRAAMLENLTAKTIFGCQYMTWKNRPKSI